MCIHCCIDAYIEDLGTAHLASPALHSGHICMSAGPAWSLDSARWENTRCRQHLFLDIGSSSGVSTAKTSSKWYPCVSVSGRGDQGPAQHQVRSWGQPVLVTTGWAGLGWAGLGWAGLGWLRATPQLSPAPGRHVTIPSTQPPSPPGAASDNCNLPGYCASVTKNAVLICSEIVSWGPLLE